MVGFDDDFPAAVARVVLRARCSCAGAVEVGVLGVGSTGRLTVARPDRDQLAVRGPSGIGEELLTRRARAARSDVATGVIVEAEPGDLRRRRRRLDRVGHRSG